MASNLNAPNIVPRYRPSAVRIGEHIREVVFFNAYRTQTLDYTGRVHNFALDILCTGVSGFCLCNEPWRKSVLTTDLQVSISQRYRDFYLREVPYPAEEILVICVLKYTEQWNDVYNIMAENTAPEGWLARGRLMKTTFYTDDDALFTCRHIDSI